MLKSKFNLRKVAIVFACLAGITMFSGCSKENKTKKETENDPEENIDIKKTPGIVKNFIATAGNETVSLLWDAPTNDGGSPITGYELTKDNWTNKVTKTASQLSHTYTGLTNGTQYTFKVRAINAKGNGAEASATAKPEAPETSISLIGTWEYGGQMYIFKEDGTFIFSAEHNGSVILAFQGKYQVIGNIIKYSDMEWIYGSGTLYNGQDYFYLGVDDEGDYLQICGSDILPDPSQGNFRRV